MHNKVLHATPSVKQMACPRASEAVSPQLFWLHGGNRKAADRDSTISVTATLLLCGQCDSTTCGVLPPHTPSMNSIRRAPSSDIPPCLPYGQAAHAARPVHTQKCTEAMSRADVLCWRARTVAPLLAQYVGCPSRIQPVGRRRAWRADKSHNENTTFVLQRRHIMQRVQRFETCRKKQFATATLENM